MSHDYPIQFGKYLLLERIAVGGMAEVFRAIFRSIEGVEKQVALKRILPEYSLDEEFVALFIDEARLSATLQHPNIVHVFDFGKLDRNYYLSMEYIDGPNLKHFVRKVYQHEQTFPIEFAVYIIIQLLKALDYLHRATDASNRPLFVIHRDISPQNILLSREGEVKITDFGIAKAASKLSKTVPGKIQGKFGYMSPEQAMGKELDHRSDLFSLGVIFFEMLTGKRLYGGENTFIRYENVKEAKIQPVSTFRKIPDELDRIVSKMLQKNPDDRYQTSTDLQKDLTDFLYPANTETVITSLAQSISLYFPKQLSRDVEIGKPEAPANKGGWWKKKAAPPPVANHNTLTQAQPTESSAMMASADKSQNTPVTAALGKPSVESVTGMHAASSHMQVGQSDGTRLAATWSLNSPRLWVGLTLVALLLLLIAKLEIINPWAFKRLKANVTELKQSNDKLNQDNQSIKNEMEQLQQRLLDLSASSSGYGEDKFRQLEQQFQREQDRWQSERRTLMSQMDSLKSQLAQATSKCPKEMIYVAPGKFFYGAAEDDPERNLGESKEVLESSKGYCIDIYEFPNRPGQLPKSGVTWSEALSMCETDGKRLCSEKEWERACKGSKNQRYFYGKEWVEGQCSTESAKGKDGTLKESGQLRGCTNDLGLFDMSGNLLEWTDTSGNALQTNPVLKGGSFDRPGYWSRCAARLESGADSKIAAAGLRCCKDPR